MVKNQDLILFIIIFLLAILQSNCIRGMTCDWSSGYLKDMYCISSQCKCKWFEFKTNEGNLWGSSRFYAWSIAVQIYVCTYGFSIIKLNKVCWGKKIHLSFILYNKNGLCDIGVTRICRLWTNLEISHLENKKNKLIN